MNQSTNEWVTCLAAIAVLQAAAKFLDDYHLSNKAKDTARFQLIRFFLFVDTLKCPDVSRNVALILNDTSRRHRALFWVICGMSWLALPPWDSFRSLGWFLIVAAFPMAIWIGTLVRLITRVVLRTNDNVAATIYALLVPLLAAVLVWQILLTAFVPAYGFILDGVEVTADKAPSEHNKKSALLYLSLVIIHTKLYFAIVTPVAIIALLVCLLVVFRTIVNALKWSMMFVVDSASSPTKSPFGYLLGAINVIIVLVKLTRDLVN